MLPLLFFVVLALRKGSRRFESTRLTTTNCATCLPSRRFNILQCKMPQGNPDTDDFNEEKLADLYNNKPWWECALLIPFDLHDHICLMVDESSLESVIEFPTHQKQHLQGYLIAIDGDWEDDGNNDHEYEAE